MAPNITSEPTGVLYEDETLEALQSHEPETPKPKTEYKRRIVWENIIIFAFLHIAAVYGAYLSLTSAKLYTTMLGKNTCG